jgi:Protein of unknown function (DUF3631)
MAAHSVNGRAPSCEACGKAKPLSGGRCGDCWDQRTDQAQVVIDQRRLGNLLNDVEGFVARYLVLPGEPEQTALTLWIAHTWAIEGAHATPYLLILSPEKRSGKTRGQEVSELLVARPWRVTGASEAAIFRRIAASRPTLLLDEIDAIFGTYGERTEPLRAILNAGNRPGATVARCVGERRDEVRDFDVFSAKCLAGIDRGSRIPDTIRDRSVTIAMRRKTGAERVERLRYRDADRQAEPLRERLGEWAETATERLLEADPAIPPELDDRAAEAWEALFAIADMAAGDWPRRVREAALALSAADDRDQLSVASLLLHATREAFGDEDRLSTVDLLGRINSDEELPFGGWRDGKGLDGRGLAKLLRPYKVKPRSIRIADNPNHKGYLRAEFEDAWERWVPTKPPQAPQAPQTVLGATQEPLEQAVVADVADVAALSGRSGTQRSQNGSEPPPARVLRPGENGVPDEAEIQRLIAVADEQEREANRLGLDAFDEDGVAA